MSSEKAARFLAAIDILASTDAAGLRMFRVRRKSTCVGAFEDNGDGTVAIRSLVGLEGAANGRAYALSAICYLSDVYDTCLTADAATVLRDVGGGVSAPEWLARFGFALTDGGDYVRLPRSLHQLLAA